MTKPVAYVPRIRSIPRVGNDVPKEVARVLQPIKEAVQVLSGTGDLAAIRRSQFLGFLRDGVRQPGVLPTTPRADEVPISVLTDPYFQELKKLTDQAINDVQGIFAQIRVNESFAFDAYTSAQGAVADLSDVADDLADQAAELAAHAADLLDLATDIDAISDDLYDPTTGLSATATLLDATIVRVDNSEDSIDVLTAQVTSLEAEIVDTSALDPGIVWQFEADDDDWTSNATLTPDDYFIHLGAFASQYFRSPSGIATDGRLFTRIVARIRRVSGTGWLGRASYATSGGSAHGIDTTNFHLTLASEPTFAGGGWVIVVWDMELLTAGGTDWTDNIIDQIQLELPDDNSTVFEVDWVAIGRVAPSFVAGVITALESRVTATEDSISALSSSVTSLETRADDIEGDIDVNTTAISSLDTRLDSAEGTISTHSSQITSLDTRLDDAESDIVASSSAISALDVRLDSAEGTISTHSTALTSLDSRLTSAEGVNTTQATAISGLDTRVTAAEGVNTSQASSITSLTSRMTAAEGVNTTQASAITSLTTSVTSLSGTVTAHSSDLVALDARLDSAESNISGSATAISLLDARVTTAEGTLTSQVSQILVLQARGGGLDVNRVNPLNIVNYAANWDFVNADVFTINIGGRNAPAARIRTSGNVQKLSDQFFVEPNQIIEVRASILKTVAHGSMFFGLHAFDDAGTTELAATEILNRTTGAVYTNPYFFSQNAQFVSSTVPPNTWFDLVFYILGNAVNAAQCPRARLNGLSLDDGVMAANPWVSFILDGFRLPVNCRRARLRILNYYNVIQTDLHINNVSAKSIDNLATAEVASERTARVSGDQANATSISTVSTTVSGHTASINSLTTSVNGISAQWVLQLDINGRISGIRLAGSPTSTSFSILADQFSVVLPGLNSVVPFTVGLVNGVSTVGINGNLVVDGTIITRHLIAEAVTTSKIARGARTPSGSFRGSGGAAASGVNVMGSAQTKFVAANESAQLPEIYVSFWGELIHNSNTNPAGCSIRLSRNILTSGGNTGFVTLFQDTLDASEVTNFLGSVMNAKPYTYIDQSTVEGFYQYRLELITNGSGSYTFGQYGVFAMAMQG